MVTFFYILSGISLIINPFLGGIIFALAVILNVRENEKIEAKLRKNREDYEAQQVVEEIDKEQRELDWKLGVYDYIDKKLEENKDSKLGEVDLTENLDNEDELNAALEKIENSNKKGKKEGTTLGNFILGLFKWALGIIIFVSIVMFLTN
tara:strand:+ start:251 stop:700 length:450 start_codon:yes stop_codon:yes gene_type:complete